MVDELRQELRSDMDHKVLHSETRIKNWVMGGILANVLVIASFGFPAVYYMGQLQAQFSVAFASQQVSNGELSQIKAKIQELEIRQAKDEPRGHNGE